MTVSRRAFIRALAALPIVGALSQSESQIAAIDTAGPTTNTLPALRPGQTIVVKTIGPGCNGDYTTLAAWEDDLDAVAENSGIVYWAECHTGDGLDAVAIGG